MMSISNPLALKTMPRDVLLGSPTFGSLLGARYAESDDAVHMSKHDIIRRRKEAARMHEAVYVGCLWNGGAQHQVALTCAKD